MTTAATAGWRVSEPGERTPDATLEFCLRRLRAEFRGEPLPEGVETLCDVRMAPGTRAQRGQAGGAALARGRARRLRVGPSARSSQWRTARAVLLRWRLRVPAPGLRPGVATGGGHRAAAPALRLPQGAGAPFPDAVDDALAALLWIGEHGPGLDSDSAAAPADGVILMGDSAGGGLALATWRVGDGCASTRPRRSRRCRRTARCARARRARLRCASPPSAPTPTLRAPPIRTPRARGLRRRDGRRVLQRGDATEDVRVASGRSSMRAGASITPSARRTTRTTRWLPPPTLIVGDEA